MTSYTKIYQAIGQQLPHYQERPGQQELTEAIGQNLRDRGTLLIEAGTGTGKTLTYLIPAFLEQGEGQLVISTATRNLQEQIYNKDMPLVKDICASDLQVHLLKGWSNYLCLDKYESFKSRMALSKQEEREIQAIHDFRQRSSDGDLAELRGVAETSPLRGEITLARENCLGRRCSFYDRCFAVRARNRAKAADIVVVNHNLLFLELALRQERRDDSPTLLGEKIRGFIIDEAHHLADIGCHSLGREVSSRKISQLVKAVEAAAKVIGLGIVLNGRAVSNGLVALATAIKDSGEKISEAALGREKEFWAKAPELARALGDFYNDMAGQLSGLLERADQSQQEELKENREFVQLQNLQRQLLEALEQLQHCLKLAEQLDNPASSEALWLEKQEQSFTLKAVPAEIGGQFGGWLRDSGASWTFLSATLTVQDSFDYFAHALGLENYRTRQLPSPFDYRRQMLLYHPPGLPEPHQPSYNAELLAAVLPVLRLSRGRAFLLFTSYSAMHRAAELLAPYREFHLLIQGQRPKNQLLEEFRRRERALLLATASFWEGVDVRGQALVCVVIDKLPFAVPTEPLVRLRHRLIQARGGNPFMEDSLPQAITTLKQGVGRLIRDRNDYGVLVIGDPRLTSKGYGKDFLNSLPPMTRTRKLELVERFYKFHD